MKSSWRHAVPANLLRTGGHRSGRPVAARRRSLALAAAVVLALGSATGLYAVASAGGATVPLTGVHAGLACGECHRSGSRPDPDDRVSPVSAGDVPATCGRCHQAQLAAYQASSHGRGAAAGEALAPTCVSCHGSHTVLPVGPDAASTFAGRISLTCARCHDDPELLRRTTLPSAAVQGFEATFHGLARFHGMSDVAGCPACHGAHQILPAKDPRSTLSSANLERTCRGCHMEVTAAMVAKVRHQEGRLQTKTLFDRFRVYFPVAQVAVNPLLIAGMGALVGFLSGLFGVGGGFLMTPLLIFSGIPAAVAAATDAAQITAGATSGALSHSRIGNVDFKMGLFIVGGGWTGGFAGVQLVRVLRSLGNFDFFLKLTYVLVLGLIGLTMLREGMRAWRSRAQTGEPSRGALTVLFARLPLQVSFPRSGLKTSAILPVAAGFLVGVLAAFLGVGGGFIMLPAMIYIIGIPTRVAVGTDLFQIVLTSANITWQQAVTNHTVDVMLAVALFVGSVIGAQFGVMASRRLRGEQIRVFLALIVLVVMAILLAQLLTPPAQLIDFASGGGGH
ncbi:MAG TPA: TSUP family transporter [Thermoanaerobaculaceae bacterium]|nr:TSUP family transporter [Thermoanaerobaculaceae bacterium]